MTSISDSVRLDPDKQHRAEPDATAKPRVHRRGALEYVAWIACALVGLGVARTLLTNENYQWDVVAQYFTAPTVLKGLVLTLVLTALTMFFGTTPREMPKVLPGGTVTVAARRRGPLRSPRAAAGDHDRRRGHRRSRRLGTRRVRTRLRCEWPGALIGPPRG